MTESERTALFQRLRDVLLAALPNAWAIYVYGSFARGDEWPSSDIDLAVLLPPGQKIPNKFELLGKLSRESRRDVDLVNLREAGLDLARELLRDGKALAVQRETDTLIWEAERITDYSEFHRRRTAIENLYLREPLRTPT